MQGEELNAVVVEPRGLLGDRCFALLDAEDGKVISAKNPRKWPLMFAFRAAYVAPPVPDQAVPAVRITLPDGTMVVSEQDGVGDILSRCLGRRVTLQSGALASPHLEEYWPDMQELDHRDTVTDEAMPKGTFFDLAPVHLLSTATLAALQRAYPEGRFEVRRFRPNLVIRLDDPQPGFVENGWIDRVVAVPSTPPMIDRPLKLDPQRSSHLASPIRRARHCSKRRRGQPQAARSHCGRS